MPGVAIFPGELENPEKYSLIIAVQGSFMRDLWIKGG